VKNQRKSPKKSTKEHLVLVLK